MTIDNSNILANVGIALNTADSDLSVDDIVYLAQSANQSANITSCVNKIDDLPDLAQQKTIEGSVYFVDEILLPVVATDQEWVGLDGRVLRKDLPDTTLFAWGYGICGAIGNLNNENHSSPVQEISSAEDWCQIATGQWNTFAIKQDGRLFGAGYNGEGQLGIGCLTCCSCFVQEISLGSNWKRVDAGYRSTIAVTKQGLIYGWGRGSSGQFGTNNTISYSSPVQEVTSATDWCHADIANNSANAIKTNGTLWGWGDNINGNLGINNTICYSSPVQEVTSATDWCHVCAERATVIALKTNGSLWGMGSNYCGVLGINNTVSNYSSPVQEITSATNWCCAVTGSYHMAAVKNNGTLWLWGVGAFGSLGTNELNPFYSSPVQEVTSATDWCTISLGFAQTMAIKTTGTLWGWGWNYRGSLGTNNNICYSSPVQEITSSSTWVLVETSAHDTGFKGNAHTAALKSTV